MTRLRSILFHTTGLLQIIIGLGAIPTGVGLMIDPYGGNLRLPYELIFETPFHSYFIPGLFLFFVNGIGSLFGAALSLTKHPFAAKLSIFLGSALLIWLACQLYWIGYVNWLQPTYVILGILEVLLGYLLLRSMQIRKQLST